jgi:hypothetical protein
LVVTTTPAHLEVDAALDQRVKLTYLLRDVVEA